MQLWFLCIVLLPAVLGAGHDYFDVLGTGKREWRLAFRGTAGIGKSIYAAYKSRQAGHVPAGCKTANWKARCNAHYRNNAVIANWRRVDKVLLGIVQGGVMVKTVTYDGAKTNYLNWMHKDRYVSSCWDDLSDKNTNFNSIFGHAHIGRRFFINHKYGGCPNDVGWLAVVDTPRPPCGWEKVVPPRQTFKFPLIKFSPGTTRTNYMRGNIMNADAIVVFVKYLPVGGSPDEYHDVMGTGKKEWRLAFRGKANVKTSVFNAYTSGTGIPRHVDAGCKTTNWKRLCRSHYRNDNALDNWKNVKEVMFGIVDNGALVKTALFNGKGSNNLSWFAANRLIRSCWDDLAAKTKNFFSAVGHARLSRRFFISHRYGGCPNDMAWFVAIDRHNPPCRWEKQGSWPTFRYAAGTRVRNVNSPIFMRNADYIVVFVKYNK